jgi:pyrroloquinoline quinone (PQQ) biosynthesis protein C
MTFFEELKIATARERAQLESAPVIERCLRGDVDRELYVAFLTQAYHHVRHTVPLLELVRAGLAPRHEWLRAELDHYIEEESGHERWVLNDIDAAGGDAEAAADADPAPATDALVAYAYDTVMRRNPIGFFGMVHVLEGTSVALAVAAAEAMQRALDLPPGAFSYLTSHGLLDREHVDHLQTILERLTDVRDRAAVVRCARVIYWLYGQMFRGLESPVAAPIALPVRRLA